MDGTITQAPSTNSVWISAFSAAAPSSGPCFSPKLTLGPGLLQGKYVGGTAQVAAGVGASANSLVGTNKVVLNPLPA
ncbi:MAG: DUF992 domain-containing protein [Methyloceanibacter sp.]